METKSFDAVSFFTSLDRIKIHGKYEWKAEPSLSIRNDSTYEEDTFAEKVFL